MKDLRMAIEYYFVDYGRFPLPHTRLESASQRIQSTGEFVERLIGKGNGWHPGQPVYMDPLPARDGRGGVVLAEGDAPTQLVDPWGSPYVILLNVSGDKVIENPDLKNSDPQMARHWGGPPPPTLPVAVAIFSLGKDKVEGTEDDIVSWRSEGGGVYDVIDWRAWVKGALVVVSTVGVVVALFYPWRSKERGASPAEIS